VSKTLPVVPLCNKMVVFWGEVSVQAKYQFLLNLLNTWIERWLKMFLNFFLIFKAKALCEKVFVVHPEFEVASKSPSFELFSDSNYCGKMKVLDKLLKLFQQEKDKVLLFSYSTQVSSILQCSISCIVPCYILYILYIFKQTYSQCL
jgi:hypothetical protein